MKKIFTLLMVGVLLAIAPAKSFAQDVEVDPVSYELGSYLSLSIPNSFEANPKNTKTAFGVGLQMFEFSLSDSKIVKGSDSGLINIYFSETSGEKGVLLSTANPKDDGEVAIMGTSAFANGIEGGEDDPVVHNSLYIIFYGAASSEFQKDGYYTLEIPDGAFVLDTNPLKGLTLLFHYSNTTETVNLNYELTPTSGDEVTDANIFMNGILVEFPGATAVDYKKKGGGSLTGPNDFQVPALYPSYEYGALGAALRYKFGYPATATSPTEWVNGQYTFAIGAGFVMVGDYFTDEEEGNFPGLTAVYILNDPSLSQGSNVTLVGIGASESYDVYSLDGRPVVLGAKPEEMGALEAGLYIINGHKVRLYK